MAKVVKHENFRVVVYPRDPGDFGYAQVSGPARTEAEERRLCDEIMRNIRRHVDGIGHVYSTSDRIECCQHCGSQWTEKNEIYNGGCCAKDEDANPNPDKDAA